MSNIRIALANLPLPTSRDESLRLVLAGIESAARARAAIVCFPESYLPGYRVGSAVDPPDAMWLDAAWARVDAAVADAGVAVVLGTERVADEGLMITARISDAKGNCLGFQDKVQLDPSEDSTYVPGKERRIFCCGGLIFGVVICHEGWRYPETVRWAARQGAQIVFHPHVEVVEDASYRPNQYGDPGNSFHEKAVLCRAAENTIYFATVNAALPGAHTTSAIADPDGALLAHQPHGQAGLLVADIDTSRATGLLAYRLRPQSP